MKHLFYTFLFLFPFALLATVRHVPGTYPGISQALAACQMGDTVLVQPGTYTGTITWPAVSGIKLLSAGDSTNTILNANASGRVVTIHTAMADANTLIRGFSIRNGFLNASSSRGAGISIDGGSPVLEELHITENHTAGDNWNYGAGVYATNGSPVFNGCSIVNNHIDSATWGHGGGIYIVNCDTVRITNCQINNNTALSDSWCYGTGLFIDNAVAHIQKTSILNNRAYDGANYYYGTGMYIADANVTVENAIIAGNTMGSGGFMRTAGIYVTGTSVVTINGTTVADNIQANGATMTASGLYINSGTVNVVNSIFYNPNPGLEVSGAALTITHTLVRGGFNGTGNINANPLFISVTDHHPGPGSPCFNAGNLASMLSSDIEDNARPIPLGANPDIGCYEQDETIVSLPENFTSAGSILYPNPTSGTITINTTEDLSDIEIYSIQGSLLKSYSKSEIQHQSLLNFEFPSGSYLFLIRKASGKQVIEKVLFQ